MERGERKALLKCSSYKNRTGRKKLSQALEMDVMLRLRFLEQKTNVMKSNWKPV